MDASIRQHRQDVIGVLRGFDRMRFRATRCYRVTVRGQQIMAAALKLRDADVVRLAA